jgi:hypothetical protein
MTTKDKEAFRIAVKKAVKAFGLKNLKTLSMFGSNKNPDNIQPLKLHND